MWLLQAEEVFSLSLKSDDELFHVHLYDWLISKNLTEKLLEVGTSGSTPNTGQEGWNVLHLVLISVKCVLHCRTLSYDKSMAFLHIY